MVRVSRLHEGVVVGDDDLRPVEVAEHVGRHQLAALVVAVRVVRLEHPQAIADGEARGDHQESACEPPAAGAAHRIDGLPRDEHGHDGGLAGAGRELQREACEAGVRLLVGRGEVVEEAAAFVSERVARPRSARSRLSAASTWQKKGRMSLNR